MTLFATALLAVTHLADQACIACVNIDATRDAGTSPAPTNVSDASTAGLDPTTVTVLVIIALVIVAICAYTLYFVRRDGYGQIPTRDTYDTRRPQP